MGIVDGILRALRRESPEVATNIAKRGGAAAKTEQQVIAHELERDARAAGAGLPTTRAAKSGAPKQTRLIDPEHVTATATTTRQRISLQGAVKPVAIGAATTAGVLAAGYAAQKIGDAVYRGRSEQEPITHDLAGGGVLYTDPITGETYVIVPKDGGAHHEDPTGKTPADHDGYEIMTVSDGNRADTKAKEAFWENLTNPVVIVGILGVVAAIIWAKSSGGGK